MPQCPDRSHAGLVGKETCTVRQAAGATIRSWVMRHPVVFCAGLTGLLHLAAWESAGATDSDRAASQLAVLSVLFVFTAVCGWWREAGLCPSRPSRQWWYVVALIGLSLLFGLLSASDIPGAVWPRSADIAAQLGLGRFVLRRFGPWPSSAAIALALGTEAGFGPSPAVSVAFAFVLAALSRRLPAVWPLVVAQGVWVWAVPEHTVPGTWHGWGLVIALLGGGCTLLCTEPVVAMGARPTVRVVCVDERCRVLLLCWHDPFDGTHTWELPGGGVKRGESSLEAARREFHEETGLDPECVRERRVMVERDSYWNGRRYRGSEPVHLACVNRPPSLARDSLEPHEQRYVEGYCWVAPERAHRLPGRVQTIGLDRIVRRLVVSDHEVR